MWHELRNSERLELTTLQQVVGSKRKPSRMSWTYRSMQRRYSSIRPGNDLRTNDFMTIKNKGLHKRAESFPDPTNM